MTRPFNTVDMFALLVGFLFLIQGIWNLIDPPFLEIFTSNLLHAIIHVVLGIIGIWTGLRSGAYIFLLFLGILLLTLGILYFLEPAKELLIELFNVNVAVAWLNIGVGGLSLLAVMVGGKPPQKVSPRSY
ncbi:DUF4383 domain-containing protein [Salinimicrobium terrae]|uniref:DUF4383 domain-containing protein n=1 Tax=Salinimicrobium terrae TaxID=470866 RepID=UPI0003F69E9C|nr:DUF4383 domain-containing protein [Salinimicrobium terrae]